MKALENAAHNLNGAGMQTGCQAQRNFTCILRYTAICASEKDMELPNNSFEAAEGAKMP